MSPATRASALLLLIIPAFAWSQSPLPPIKPEDFAAQVTSPAAVLLTWRDPSRLERSFEILRKKSTSTTWELVVTTAEDVVMYHDTQVLPNSTYWYKIRGINATANGPYAPGESLTDPAQSVVVNTPNETTAPTAPLNLVAENTALNTVTLTWQASTDASGIREYQIKYGTVTINTHSTSTTYTIPNLAVNSIYYFTVAAIDVAGNVSSKSVQAMATTTIDVVFYRYRTGTWLNSGTPDIRMVPWSSNATFGGSFPVNVRTNVSGAITGNSPNWAGTFNTAANSTVLFGSVILKRNSTAFAHVDCYGKIIRDSDGVEIGVANLTSPNGAFNFTNAQTGTYTLDYTWTFNQEATGKVNTFTIGSGGVPLTQNDFFIVEYDGYLNINAAGAYQFQTISNDAVLLYIDGTLVCSDFQGDASNSNTETTSPVGNATLSLGPHRITVRYMEYDQNHRLDVQWRATAGLDAGTTFVNIPLTSIKSNSNNPLPTAPSRPTSLTATQAGMTQINLNWAYTSGIKISVLGSSTAEGIGSSIPVKDNGWVGRYRTYLNTRLPGSTVTNYGTGGYRTENVLPYPQYSTGVPAKNVTQALSDFPDVILVNLPANDAAAFIPNATTMNNYSIIKSIIDARGIPLFVTTTQPRAIEPFDKRQVLFTQTQSIRVMFGDHTIDTFDELATADYYVEPIYNSGDDIHINDAGHIYIMGVARDLLEPYLEGFTSFEVHRATISAGPYTHIATVTTRNYQDTNLKPGTQYFYRIKTLKVYGTSDFTTTTANATTLTDNVAPSQPTNVNVTSVYTSASLTWTASTDNVGVTGYEVYVNGSKVGTSSIPAYTATSLSPSTIYSYTVKAVDAAGNLSTASQAVNVSTGNPYVFYSKTSGNLHDVGTWGIGPDGSGPGPASFSGDAHVYNMSNRSSTSMSNNWTIGGSTSKLVIPTGVTFTVNNNLTARLEVQGTAKVILEYPSIPEFISVSPQSIIEYKIANFNLAAGSYGSLLLTTPGVKTFAAGTTTIAGEVQVASGSTIQGAQNNASILSLSGNYTHDGTPGDVETGRTFSIIANKPGTQTFSVGGNLSYFDITTSTGTNLAFSNTSSNPINMRVERNLRIANGTTVNIGNNNLIVGNSINSSNETGKLSINGGSMEINSTSGENSNLYFDENNKVTRLTQDLVGGGKVFVRSAMQIQQALKVKNGEIAANGFLTLISNATHTANIERIEGTGSITGDVHVQRYLEPKSIMYRYFSSPVDGLTVADWQEYFPITGNFEGHSAGHGSNPSMYQYNESAGGWVPYPPPNTDNQRPILKGVGYSVYQRNGNESVNMEVTGTPFQGNHTYTLIADPSASTTDGWNLAGNPYASTISWANDGWTKGQVSNTISVRENPSGTFRYYFYDPDLHSGVGSLTGGKIAPGQSFWVQSVGANPLLTITESAKSTEQGTMLREGESIDHLLVNVKGNGYEDPTYIVLTDRGSEKFEMHTDAVKRANDHLGISSTSGDGVSLAINNIGTRFCTADISLSIDGATNGRHTISFSNVASVMQHVKTITLKDLFTARTITVEPSTEYSFDVTNDPLSKGNGRFKLTLERINIPEPTVELRSDTLYVNASGNITWQLNGTTIEGASDAIYIPKENGNYTATVSVDKCWNVSKPESYTKNITTGIEDKPTLKLDVYPQPAAPNELYVDITSDAPSVNLRIVDMVGRLHTDKHVAPGTHRIELPEGIYLVRIADGDQSIVRKVLIANVSGKN